MIKTLHFGIELGLHKKCKLVTDFCYDKFEQSLRFSTKRYVRKK